MAYSHLAHRLLKYLPICYPSKGDYSLPSSRYRWESISKATKTVASWYLTFIDSKVAIHPKDADLILEVLDDAPQ